MNFDSNTIPYQHNWPQQGMSPLLFRLYWDGIDGIYFPNIITPFNQTLEGYSLSHVISFISDISLLSNSLLVAVLVKCLHESLRFCSCALPKVIAYIQQIRGTSANRESVPNHTVMVDAR